MEVIVTGRQLDITDAIRAHASERAGRFPRHFDGVGTVEVVLRKRDRFFEAELIVHVSGREHFVAKGDDTDLYASIDHAADRIERQLHDHKERLRAHKHAPREP